MGMDSALVAAYRNAKISTIPYDAIGPAMGKLEQDLYAGAEKLRAAKMPQVKSASDILDEIELTEKGWKQDEKGNWVPPSGSEEEEVVDYQQFKDEVSCSNAGGNWQESIGMCLSPSPANYKSAFHYNSPFHVNDPETVQQFNDIKTEVYASDDWKNETQKIAANPSGLGANEHNQLKVVFNSSPPVIGNIAEQIDAVRNNEEALSELIENGTDLGDEIWWNEQIKEYDEAIARGETTTTMFNNKMNEANAKATLIGKNMELRKALDQSIAETEANATGKRSYFAKYDPSNELYNALADWGDPNNVTGTLQEDGSYTKFSPKLGKELTMPEIEKMHNDTLVDTEAQFKSNKMETSFKEKGANDANKVNPSLKLENDSVLTSNNLNYLKGVKNFTSLVFDDDMVTTNNSSIFKDFDEHPEFKALAAENDPTPNTPLTANDMKNLKDAFFNPKNPLYNEDRAMNLVAEYMTERQKAAYNKAYDENLSDKFPGSGMGGTSTANKTTADYLKEANIDPNLFK